MCAVQFSTENEDGKKTKVQDKNLVFILQLTYGTFMPLYYLQTQRSLFIVMNWKKLDKACLKQIKKEHASHKYSMYLCYVKWLLCCLTRKGDPALQRKKQRRGAPDVFSPSSCSSLSQNIPAKSVPLREGTHTNTLTSHFLGNTSALQDESRTAPRPSSLRPGRGTAAGTYGLLGEKTPCHWGKNTTVLSQPDPGIQKAVGRNLEISEGTKA